MLGKRTPARGLTLIENLGVLIIISVILAAALPPFTKMTVRQQTIAELNRLVGAVNLTRHTAVQFSTTATLCGLHSSGQCGASWAAKLTVFLDRNRNARLDDNDEPVSFIQPLNTGSSIRWRSFQNRQYIQMTRYGYTNYQNGNFVICPASADPALARQVIINIQGRTRLNRAADPQGISIDRLGRKLRC